MVNPQQRVEYFTLLKKWLKDNMYECDRDEKWVNTYFHTMEEMFNDFEKTIGE